MKDVASQVSTLEYLDTNRQVFFQRTGVVECSNPLPMGAPQSNRCMNIAPKKKTLEFLLHISTCPSCGWRRFCTTIFYKIFPKPCIGIAGFRLCKVSTHCSCSVPKPILPQPGSPESSAPQGAVSPASKESQSVPEPQKYVE